jgi:tetratricopeptide (TPR) repeat protein
VILVPAALVLLVIGVGAGTLVGRRFIQPPAGGGAAVGTPSTGLPSAVSQIEAQALRQAASRPDAPIAALLQLAHIDLDQGRLAEARQGYERVLAREPRNVEAITHLGAVLYQEGRLDDALAKVEEALRLDPSYIHAHWDRTQYLYSGKRDYPGAIRAAEAFLKVVPTGPDADQMRQIISEAKQEAAKSPPLLPRPR